MWENKGWCKIVLHARLTSPMIVGLGENHPSETGILLDRNLGIPYIPASSIKGVVRFAHTIGLLKDENGKWLDLDVLRDRLNIKGDKNSQLILEEDSKTRIPELFGQAEKDAAQRGALIVLDSYPLDIPRLKVDIMNPHYNEYYQGKRGPTEDQNPVPLKFLVVDQGAEFVFRAIVKHSESKEGIQDELAALCEKAYRQALTEEGVGAKTALGYGRFSVLAEDEPSKIEDHIKQLEAEKENAREQELLLQEKAMLEQMSPDEKLLEKIKRLNKDGQMIADMVRECLETSDNREVFQALKANLQELGEWKPDGAKQRKEKMRARNESIEKKL
jgi:CRISPR-associated protein Cmr6